jgi:hypothetical protein
MTTVEILMEFVAPFLGSLVVALVLRAYTSLPTWGCVLIALPLGTLLAWLVILTVLFATDSILNYSRAKQGNQDRANSESGDQPPN